MRDASDAVDAYLTTQFGVGLEQVLLDVTQGLISLVLVETVRASVERVAEFRHPDGGTSEMHQGTLTVAGVAYRFRGSVFIDTSGRRFVADLREFMPVGWTTQLTMSNIHG
jgi:hypothetical protein